jgi:hypothetical protein
VPVCPRPSDLISYDDLLAPSIASMQGRGKAEYSRAPRFFAHALNVSAYRMLLDLEMARARADSAGAISISASPTHAIRYR